MATFPQGRGSKWSLASTKEQERGLNRRQDRQFMLDLGRSVLDLGTTLGLEYAKYEKLGGKEKTMALATEAAAKATEARAQGTRADAYSGSLASAATLGKERFDFEKNQWEAGRTPETEAERKLRLAAEKLAHERALALAKAKKSGSGANAVAVAARQDAKTKAGLEADIQRIRAAIAHITDPADPRLPGLMAELKTQQGAAAWYESKYKVRGAEGEAALKPEKKVKEKTLQQNLKTLYNPAVYTAYSKSKDIQSVVLDATSRLGGEFAKGKTIKFEGRRYPAMEFIDDLRNLPIDRQKERLERIAAEAVKGNADCQAIWNEIALSLTGEE